MIMKKITSIPAIIAACMMTLTLMLAQSPCFAAGNDTILIPYVKITPSTLNMKSKGKFITAHLDLPGQYSDVLPQPEDITLRMIIGDNETGDVVALKTGWAMWGRIVVKFPRSEVQELIAENVDQFPARVVFSITINVDNETLAGSDDIRIIKPGKKGKGGKN